MAGKRDGRSQSLPRKIISWFSRFCVKMLYGRKTIWDVNTPYRLMRVSSFAPFYKAIPLSTFAPNVIISGLVARNGLRYYEIPVPQHDRTTGEVSIKKWKLLKAAMRSFAQTISFSLTFRMLIGACIAVSILKFILAALAGPVSDTVNFAKTADVVLNGQWPWLSYCYNYGPLWAGVEVLMKTVFGDGLHVAAAFFTSIADVSIALLLWRCHHKVGAFLFLLAPIGVYVSGVNRMFDNVAIAIVFAGLVLYGDESRYSSWRQTLALSILVGISITIKHVCLFLPLWLFWHEKTWGRRIIMLVVPWTVFALGFAIPIGCEIVSLGGGTCMTAILDLVKSHAEFRPWLFANFPVTASIYKMVFTYYSYGHSYFWEYLAPAFCVEILPAKTWFVVVMIVLSVLGRKLSQLNIFAIYLLSLFAFSPGYNSYYWAIPLLTFSCASFNWYAAFNFLSLIVVWYRFPDPFGHLPLIPCPHALGSMSQVLSVGLVAMLFLKYVCAIAMHNSKALPFSGDDVRAH